MGNVLPPEYLGATTLLRCGVALGMGGIFEGKEANQLSKADYISILAESVDLGFRLVDTAPAYAGGVSEEIVGEVARRRRSELVLATKVSPQNLDFQGVLKSVDESLTRLKTDYVDLLQVHWPNPMISLSETAEAMLTLIEAGKVRWLGVANFSTPELSQFSSLVPSEVLISSQVEMSAIDQFEVSRSLRWADDSSRVTLAYSPLGKGRLAQNTTIHAELSKIADRIGASLPQLLLLWLSRLGRVVPVVASRNLSHLRENLAFQEVSLSDEELQAVGRILEQDQVKYVVPSDIRVATDGDGGRDVYLTRGQAIENSLGFSPSPEELAAQILNHPDIKPVRVQRRGETLYLVEGRVRYWAWVIAFGEGKRIPVIEVSSVVG